MSQGPNEQRLRASLDEFDSSDTASASYDWQQRRSRLQSVVNRLERMAKSLEADSSGAQSSGVAFTGDTPDAAYPRFKALQEALARRVEDMDAARVAVGEARGAVRGAESRYKQEVTDRDWSVSEAMSGPRPVMRDWLDPRDEDPVGTVQREHRLAVERWEQRVAALEAERAAEREALCAEILGEMDEGLQESADKLALLADEEDLPATPVSGGAGGVPGGVGGSVPGGVAGPVSAGPGLGSGTGPGVSGPGAGPGAGAPVAGPGVVPVGGLPPVASLPDGSWNGDEPGSYGPPVLGGAVPAPGGVGGSAAGLIGGLVGGAAALAGGAAALKGGVAAGGQGVRGAGAGASKGAGGASPRGLLTNAPAAGRGAGSGGVRGGVGAAGAGRSGAAGGAGGRSGGAGGRGGAAGAAGGRGGAAGGKRGRDRKDAGSGGAWDEWFEDYDDKGGPPVLK